jgi:hypothetical protein
MPREARAQARVFLQYAQRVRAHRAKLQARKHTHKHKHTHAHTHTQQRSVCSVHKADAPATGQVPEKMHASKHLLQVVSPSSCGRCGSCSGS